MSGKPAYEDLEKEVKDLKTRLLHYEGEGSGYEFSSATHNSADILTALLNHTSDYILICDEKGVPRVFNKAYAKIIKKALGIDMKPGVKPHELLNDPEAVKYWDQVRNRALGGDRFSAEYTHEFAKDNIRTLEVSFTPIENDNQIKGFVEVTRDVTDRKQIEDALRESEEKYMRIYENFQDVYYESGMDGTIFEVSPSIEKNSQYSRKELIGKSLYDIYTNPKRTGWICSFCYGQGKGQ